MGDWDYSLKSFMNENPQDFVAWIFKDAKVVRKLQTEFQKRKIDADSLLEIEEDGERFLLHTEFQARRDPKIAERLLEYSFEARREHGQEVYSCVIYLQENGNVPEPPLRWELKKKRLKILEFNYINIELPRMSADEIRQTGLLGIQPLMLLTRDGATEDVVNEIIEKVKKTDNKNLLSLTYLIASLGRKNTLAQDWLDRRFAMLEDILRETPAYQKILEKGRLEEREKAQQEKVEAVEKAQQEKVEAVERTRQQAQQELIETQRNTLLNIIFERFPTLLKEATPDVQKINNLQALQQLIVKMATIPTEEQARIYLQAVSEKNRES